MIEVLSEAEVFELTRYKRPKQQLRTLAELGIPAVLLHDKTVRVLRKHLQVGGTPASANIGSAGPQLKSSRNK
jgi:hypothetical protein